MIFHKAPIHPYALDLWVIITSNPHKDVTRMNVTFPGLSITWNDTMAAWTNDHLYDGYIICVVFDKKYFEPDTVAHEAIHIANHVFTHSDIKYDSKNDEPLAYLVGWIVGEIYRANKSKK